MDKIHYYQYVQYVGLLLCIIYFRSLKKYTLQLLLPLILLGCIIETAAQFHLEMGLKNNYTIYTCYLVGSAFLYYAIFLQILQLRGVQRTLFFIIVCLTALLIFVEMFWISPGRVLGYSITFYMVQHVFLSCWVIARLAMNETHPVRLSREPYFWFATGLLVFSMTCSITQGLHAYILKNHLYIAGKPLYQVVTPVLIVIMYTCYSVAIVLSSRSRPLSPTL